MKKVVLSISLLFFSFNVLSQELIKLNDLVGYWKPNEESTQLVMWFDNEDRFQMIEFSTITGVPLNLLSMMLVGDKLKIKTKYIPTNHTSESVFTFLDKQTLKCETIDEDKNVSYVIYSKVK